MTFVMNNKQPGMLKNAGDSVRVGGGEGQYIFLLSLLKYAG